MIKMLLHKAYNLNTPKGPFGCRHWTLEFGIGIGDLECSCLDESENRHWNHSPIPSGIGATTAPSPIIRSLAPRYSSAFASSSPASSTAPPLHRAAPPPPSPAPPRRSPPPPNPAPPRQSPPPPSLALLPSTHESPRRPTPASCSSLLRRGAATFPSLPPSAGGPSYPLAPWAADLDGDEAGEG